MFSHMVYTTVMTDCVAWDVWVCRSPQRITIKTLMVLTATLPLTSRSFQEG